MPKVLVQNIVNAVILTSVSTASIRNDHNLTSLYLFLTRLRKWVCIFLATGVTSNLRYSSNVVRACDINHSACVLTV
jgi:hypothetical protein